MVARRSVLTSAGPPGTTWPLYVTASSPRRQEGQPVTGYPVVKSARQPAEQGRAGPLDGCRPVADRPLPAVGRPEREVGHHLGGPEPSHLLVEEAALELGLDVVEGEPRVEVDVVVGHLPQPHERNPTGLDEEHSWGSLQAQVGVVRAETWKVLGQHGGALLDVLDELRGGPAGPGLDVGVARLLTRVHRLAGPLDRGADEGGEALGVAGDVAEHVPPGPPFTQGGRAGVVEA